jgi:hypothetical protein
MAPPIALNLARIEHRLLVHPRGWRVDRLMDELSIAPRTYRKYRALLDEHFEANVVEVREGAARYLRLQPHERETDDAEGFLAHVATFWLARRVYSFAGNELSAALDAAMADLLDRVRDKPFWIGHVLGNTDRLPYFVPDAPKDYSGHSETIAVLLRALFFGRTARVLV